MGAHHRRVFAAESYEDWSRFATTIKPIPVDPKKLEEAAATRPNKS
jgi:hypothetical protein